MKKNDPKEMTQISFFDNCVLFNSTEELIDEHEKSKTVRKYTDETEKKLYRKPKTSNTFTISHAFGKKYQTEIASPSPNFSKTSLAVETTQMDERYFRSDIISIVRQVYGKYSTSLRHANHSTLFRRKNFWFQIVFSVVC